MIILILCPLFVYFYMFPRPQRKQKYEHYHCAIVLGFPSLDNGDISDILKSRIDQGIKLYQQHRVDYLILSGGHVKNEYNESEVMYQYCLQKGLPQDCLIIENQSVSTYHNMLYSKTMMEQHHFKTAMIVTSSWHLRKANHYAKSQQLDYVMVKAKNPPQYSLFHNIKWHITTNIMTFVQLCRGYY